MVYGSSPAAICTRTLRIGHKNKMAEEKFGGKIIIRAQFFAAKREKCIILLPLDDF